AEEVVDAGPVLAVAADDTARVGVGPGPGPLAVRPRPSGDLLDGQRGQLADVPHPPPGLEQPGDRGAALQAPQALQQRIVHSRPGLPQRVGDDPRKLAGPAAGAGVEGVAPGQDLGLGQLGAATVAVLPPLAEPWHGQPSPLPGPRRKGVWKNVAFRGRGHYFLLTWRALCVV